MSGEVVRNVDPGGDEVEKKKKKSVSLWEALTVVAAAVGLVGFIVFAAGFVGGYDECSLYGGGIAFFCLLCGVLAHNKANT